jgi:hypothetical protein
MLAAVPTGERSGAAFELVQALEEIYERHSTRRPGWLDSVAGHLV